MGDVSVLDVLQCVPDVRSDGARVLASGHLDLLLLEDDAAHGAHHYGSARAECL